MPEGMTFLPDEKEIELSPGVGIVSAPLTALRSLASPKSLSVHEPTWRGLTALCFLADAWLDGPRITVRAVMQTAFAAATLDGPAQLILCDGHVLGLLHPRLGIIPAATLDALDLPARVTWYDGVFEDPAETLCARDRAILIHRLSALDHQGEPLVQRYLAALTQAGLQAAHGVAHQEEAALRDLTLRMQAILGSMPGVTAETAAYAPASANPLLRALDLTERPEPDHTPAITWLYQGVPFARSHPAVMAEEAPPPGAASALASLRQDMSLLERYSAAWNVGLLKGTKTWLHDTQQNRSLLPGVRAIAEEIIQRTATPAPHEPLHLTWPWRAGGVEQALWQEALGTACDAGMVAPFADKLCILQDGGYAALGDPTLRRMCVLPGERMDAVVPPLSQAMAACMGTMLLPESFRFQYTMSGGVTVSFVLMGQAPVMLERTYAPSELRILTADETPTVALWPRVALPEDSWKAYYVYVHGGSVRASALGKDGWQTAEDRLFSIIHTETFPRLVALHEDGQCLGVLRCDLPLTRPMPTGPALGLMEVGASGVTLAMSRDGQSSAFALPDLTHTLLQGKQVSLGEEFLPAAPLGPTLPAAVELFTLADAPLPFTDGHILMPESCATLARHDERAMHSAWKWNVDASSRRALRLLLHQSMLMLSLSALMNGATSIAWRMALPEGMGAEGRRQLWQLVTDLAPTVAACGLPLAERTVTHADESMALGAYLRGDGGIRGGFLALDIGSCDASLALWLRGMNRPAARFDLPLGVQSMLLDALLQAPAALQDDFADMPENPAKQSILLLADMLQAASGRKAVEKCRCMLDQCLTTHGPALAAHMTWRFNQGRITLMQSLIFQGFAAALAISGLTLEQVQRDPLLNDYLPAELTFLLTGRGSQLMAALPDNLKSALAQFARLELSPGHPAQQLRFLFTTGKTETVLGLAQIVQDRGDPPAAPRSTRASASMPPPEAWLHRFLSGFRAVFPQAYERIYGPVMEEGRIRAVTARHCTPSAEPEAALAACLAELRQVDAP